MNEIVESAKYYSFIKDYLPIIQILLLILFTGLFVFSLYSYIDKYGQPDKRMLFFNLVSISLLGMCIILICLLFNMPKMMLFSYSDNVLKEEYKLQIEEHFSFIKEKNNIDEEKSSYYFSKDKETNDYYLHYIIYVTDKKTFVLEDENIDSFLKGHIKYSVQNNYFIE